MLIQHLYMVLLLDIPYEDTLVHASRHKEAGVGCPAEVEDVFCVPHESSLGGPAQDAFRSVDGERVLSFFPDGDAFIIGARGQEATMGRIADYVGILVSLE